MPTSDNGRPSELAATRRRAREARARFESLIRGVAFERRGVLFSEMLFLLAAVGEHRPARIVESGRARGQSTWVLARCWPGIPIVSVERDAASEDAAFARERLRPFANVELVQGDAWIELPRRVGRGDVVLIDGPKGWHAVRLALALLERSRPARVFLHDCHRGLDERRFLERRVPGACFSDDPEFVNAHRDLDAPCFEPVASGRFEGWEPFRFEGRDQESYGPTLACLPYREDVAYASLRRRSAVAAALSRLRRSLAKRFGRRRTSTRSP